MACRNAIFVGKWLPRNMQSINGPLYKIDIWQKYYSGSAYSKLSEDSFGCTFSRFQNTVGNVLGAHFFPIHEQVLSVPLYRFVIFLSLKFFVKFVKAPTPKKNSPILRTPPAWHCREFALASNLLWSEGSPEESFSCRKFLFCPSIAGIWPKLALGSTCHRPCATIIHDN